MAGFEPAAMARINFIVNNIV